MWYYFAQQLNSLTSLKTQKKNEFIRLPYEYIIVLHIRIKFLMISDL